MLLCYAGSGFLVKSVALNNMAGDKLPHTNHDRAWRIGYCESGEFSNYASTLNGLIGGLAELGWISGIENLPYVNEQQDTRMMWKWLASQPLGPYIEFVGDAYYSFGHMDKGEQLKLREQIIQRLNGGDIDLMIVMGTQAGQGLSNNLHHVPTLVFSTSNAVQTGILSSATDSGLDHIWGHMDSGRYRRQLEVFHDLFAFKKLGIVYEDSVDGKSYAALEDVEAVAKERGFTIVRYFVKDRQHNKELYRQEMLAAHRKLIEEGVDAFYSTLYFDRDVKELPQLFAPFYERKIPIFAQQGSVEVRNGALLSIARADFRGIGRFGAGTIAQVLHGVLPRQLPQTYENTPNIVLNMEVAEKIGYVPTFETLLVADEIYPFIEKGK